MSKENASGISSEIRVIAPSYSREPGYEERDTLAEERLGAFGYKVTFGDFLDEQYHLGTASVESRSADLHAAIADENVAAIMAYSGGWSANELLPRIDWDLLKDNPKPLIGYSDITVLHNAIYAKTGQVSHLGPDFGAIGAMDSWQYTLDNFNNALRQDHPIELKPSQAWKVLQEGEAEAVLLGGNLNTFHLLQGTEYQPKLDKPFILAAEEDDETGKLTAQHFSRRLESILQLPGARENLQGIIIGRFLPESEVAIESLAEIIKSKQLPNIPVIAEVDFGHTAPLLTLPIGGVLRILANEKSETQITIEK